MTDRTLPPCSILLLAGGRGARMGGQDKGLLSWRGRPLISWLHETVRPLTDDLIISCNRNQDRYAAYADRLVSDQEAEFPGPMAGIRAGLAVARTSLMMVLPCDAPQVDRALLTCMRQQQLEHPDRPLMVRQGQQWEPLFCLFPLGCQAHFEAAWQQGERSARRVMLTLDVVALEVAPGDPRTANLNTPELLTSLARETGGPRH